MFIKAENVMPIIDPTSGKVLGFDVFFKDPEIKIQTINSPGQYIPEIKGKRIHIQSEKVENKKLATLKYVILEDYTDREPINIDLLAEKMFFNLDGPLTPPSEVNFARAIEEATYKLLKRNKLI